MYKILSTLSRTSSALYESKSYNIITRRNLAVSSFLLKKGLDPTADVILLGNKDKQIKMKYSEVLDKVGDRKLVKIQMTKKVEAALPMFKIMSDVDLEIAARKARAETKSGYLGSKVIYETESGRLKQKQIELKSKLTDHDLCFQTAKISKWLQKGHFVRVDIKLAKGSDKADAEKIKLKIEAEMSDHKELLGQNNSKLVINIK